jgi:DNA-binding MarR family transcriptional regulator
MTVERRPKARSEPAPKQKLRLWLRLLGTSRSIEIELRQRLRAAFGVTLPQFDVMAALDRRPAGITMTELSRVLLVSNGNVTGIVDRLVTDGLVVRLAHDGDRRATFVRLTRKGTQRFQAMASAHEAWVAELLSGIDAAGTETLMQLLGALAPRPVGWVKQRADPTRCNSNLCWVIAAARPNLRLRRSPRRHKGASTP